MSLLKARFAAQQFVKGVTRTLGVEVRHTHQNPQLSNPQVFSRWFSPTQVKTVFDVGANTGQSAAAYLVAYPNCTVYSFEPFTAAFGGLRKLADASNGRLRALQLACGDIDGRVNVARADGSSQLNQLDRSVAPAATQGDADSIEIRTLDSLCSELKIEKIDLLKTDTEGFDARVLAGGARMLGEHRVKCVVVEVGFLDDPQHSRFDEIYPMMAGHGYELAGLYELMYHADLSADLANAVFVSRK